MNLISLEIAIIACLVSVASVLPGIFLLLRGVSLMTDAISHAILLGIVVMFLLVQRLESPLLIIGAALAGIATVIGTELLIESNRLKKDAAIGLVFPLFFSIGVILISKYARNVHLDTDMILLGEIAFAPFNRLTLFGVDVGPYAFWLLGGVLGLNVFFIIVLYKELVLSTFDSQLAHLFGFSPTFIYYILMSLTSVTAVSAFDVVGSIVVVALMISPPATAYLLTHNLKTMIWLSIGCSIASALMGYALAYVADVSIAGSIATMSGIIFLIALFCSPQKGIVSHWLQKHKRKNKLAIQIICAYLAQSKSKSIDQEMLSRALGWDFNFLDNIIVQSIKSALIEKKNDRLILTDLGAAYAQERR
jgi:manganese/zinc/iron transport system permease protein